MVVRGRDQKGWAPGFELLLMFQCLTSRAIVISTAKELGVTVAAYSPLGRGFLTGTIKSPADLTREHIPTTV